MDKDEYQALLKSGEWSQAAALRLVYLLTGVEIDPREIAKSFDRYGRLSRPMTATLRLLGRYHVDARRAYTIAH